MSGTASRSFHFTLGPVQSFVAQARRTRDFWAGSFILSWLAAVAMLSVKRQGGEIRFPKPDGAFMSALEGGGEGPKQGNVPNRFRAEVSPEFKPELVQATVLAAWRELAELVWRRDLGAAWIGTKTRETWLKQVENFWDIQWALGDAVDAGNALDRMKNWRTHVVPDQAGVKCMMMDGWSELSGAERPGREPEMFWSKLRQTGSFGMATDLREGEMLCAMAFIKRRFARHFEGLSAKIPLGGSLRGWTLPSAVPSVHYIAAAPWFATLLQATTEPEIKGLMSNFHAGALALTGDYGEWESDIRCVREASGSRLWHSLDGTVFFDSMLENARLWGEKADAAKALAVKLRELRGAAGIGPASPFYAVLLMDGDELGIHMSNERKQGAITDGLARFTAKVPEIVHRNSGFLVYAGGDDVLAALPLEHALACATELRGHYLSCFDTELIPTTLSGAIEFAHVKMPLGKVLHDAHDLLDNVAKDGRGRDAIACRVWKPGGVNLEWAMPWELALKDGEVIIERLVAIFQDGMSSGNAEMASAFFYRIRERFDLLAPSALGSGGVLNEEEQLDFLAMEYLNSGLVRDKALRMDEARERVKPLLDQCRPMLRVRQGSAVSFEAIRGLEADGALLVRFLAHKGIER